MGTRLAGKRALAIGCGQGFGAVTAHALAAEGASVMVADIDADKTGQVAQDITQAGGQGTSHWVDIGEEDAIRELVDATAERLGGIDVVFNNAAAVGTPATFDDSMNPVMAISADVWDVTMKVNLRGPWLVSKYAIPYMVRNGGGSIINTGSLAAEAIMPKSGAYSVSKAGVNTLSKVIATQYGRQGIRCNTINPGYIETRHIPKEYGETVMARHTLVPRLGNGDDIAMLVVYLASDESGYMTGQSITLDGGFFAHGPTWAEMSQADSPKNRIGPDGSLR
ncbi:MAG: SDR family oxidoreductase [Acidimicrobiales bacterium]|jgi:NAD(P)-dependent dehydrogenase (short-subunit alcohol dehydrogenase family)